MAYLAGAIIGIYIVIAGFHIYWGLGGKVYLDRVLPSKEGEKVFMPSKLASLSVALLVLSFALVFYFLYFDVFNSTKLIYAGWIISAIFLLRSIGDFKFVGFFKKIKDSRFAKYDTKFFSPLCLLLACGSAMITYQA